jgi:hypothetical protein
VIVKEGEWYTMRVVANKGSYKMFIDETFKIFILTKSMMRRRYQKWILA